MTNWPQRGDLKWLLKAGGVFSKSGHEPPSNRFNAGEKVMFWLGVLVLGVIVVASGLVMDKLIPNLVYDRATMQVAHMVHAVSTVLMMCLFALHIYLGTIGMRGAYTRDAHRLRGRALGPGAPRILVRRHRGRQDSRHSAASRWLPTTKWKPYARREGRR